MINPFYIALGIIWLVFITVWIIGATTAKRTAHRNWFGEIWWRAGIIVSIIIIVQILWGSPYITGMVNIPLLNIIGVICTGAGVGLSIWARVYLGRNWGMPMTQKVKSRLVTTGPYTYIRHPIYTGVLLALLGSALVNWWWAVIFVWTVAYFTYASGKEEQLMCKKFRDTYNNYKMHTWKFIPFIW